MRYHQPVSLFAVITICCTVASAQRAAQPDIVSSFSTDPVEMPRPAAYLTETGAVTYSREPVTPTAGQFTTAVIWPGGITTWRTGVTPITAHCLVSGSGSQSGPGRIEHWTWVEGALTAATLEGATNLSGMDPISCVFDDAAGQLFVLDYTSKAIVKVPWTGTGAAPATGWTSLVTQVALPELADADAYVIRPTSTASVLALYERVHDTFVLDRFSGAYLINGTTAGVTPVSAPQQPTLSYEVLTESIAAGADTVEVRVYGSDASTFQLWDLAKQALLGTADASPPHGPFGSVLTIPSETLLEIGNDYIVKRSNEPLHASFGIECVARWGFPENSPSGLLTMQSLYIAPRLEVGNPEYPDAYIIGGVTVGEQAVLGIDGYLSVLGMVNVGFLGIHSVVPFDGSLPFGQVGNYLLDTNLMVSANAVITHVPGEATLASDAIAVPNDPAFVGMVLLFQSVAIYGTEVVFSDVVGQQFH